MSLKKLNIDNHIIKMIIKQKISLGKHFSNKKINYMFYNISFIDITHHKVNFTYESL